MKYYHYITSFGGNVPYDGYVLDKISCYGCNDDDPAKDSDFLAYQADSAYRPTNLPQIRLEPILQEQAIRRNPSGIRFHHRVTSVQEREDHVVVDILDRNSNTSKTYRAKYLIAGDGGRTVGPTLGISYEGEKNSADATSVRFRADISKYWKDGSLMTWIIGLLGGEDAVGTSQSLFGAEWSALVMSGPTWAKKAKSG